MGDVDNKTARADLPQIDLGYSVYQAAEHNDVGDFYTFSNIRYAAPPTGNRRFRPPEAPLTDRNEAQSGLSGSFPIQAIPLWRRQGMQVMQWTSMGSEDCLFLDVKVPRSVWDGRRTQGKGAAVLVWIYGGGYTAGTKEIFGSGAGLLARSAEPIIYVALNYRLGMYGFLAGPKYTSQGGTANLGLLDQRFALEWIQKHISEFGGDPSRVTVMGESAGGGSILHQITAYGGRQGKAPFAQAVIQSPGFYPISSPDVMDRDYQSALKHAGCDTLEELRCLPEEKLKEVNLAVMDAAPYGQFLLGPVVDGIFTPDLPGRLLLYGSFDHSPRLMLGQCYNEGGDAVEPAPVEISCSYISAYLDRTFPGLTPSDKDHVTGVLYPPPISTAAASNNGGPPTFSLEPPYYTTASARLQRLISDAIYIQHNNALSTAFDNKTYNYLMSLSPGTHGTDMPYIFYNVGKDDDPPLPGMPKVKSKEMAHILQRHLTNFVVYGDPNGDGDGELPKMRARGDEGVVLNFGEDGIEERRDPSAKQHCVWWQQGLYA